MRALPRPLDRYSPPSAVLGLLLLEFVVTGVLLVLGVPWPSLLASAGPVIALTLALLNPTVQELGRRQPRLTVTTRDGDSRVVAPAARPWPVDAARVVANEVADAQETAKRRHSSLDSFFALSEPFAIRPSQADHEQSQEKFEAKVEKFEDALRGWLAEYIEAARAYANTFEVQIAVHNATSGAHAEAVTVVLELPETVAVVEDLPSLPPPPDRPFYKPPQGRPISDHSMIDQLSAVRNLGRVVADRLEPMRFPMDEAAWNISDDGRQVEASVGDVHPSRSVAVGEPLLLRASGPGGHDLRWMAFSKSARKETSGTISLEVPSDPARPAFGRLGGIRRYPDVPFVGEDGKVVTEVRNSEPPHGPEPESETEDEGPLKTLREARTFAEWRELGLDPAHDGPDRSTVRKAKQA